MASIADYQPVTVGLSKLDESLRLYNDLVNLPYVI